MAQEEGETQTPKPKRLGVLGRLSPANLLPSRRNKSVDEKAGGDLVHADETADGDVGSFLETSDLSRLCMNCGTPLSGPFCQACGQKHDDIRRPMWSFIKQVLDDVISTDSRTWRTLLMLVFIPGRLSRDYNDGKRARFLPPLRLYIITTILFFFTLQMTSTAVLDVELIKDDEAIEAFRARELVNAADQLEAGGEAAGAALEALLESGILTDVEGEFSDVQSEALIASLISQREALIEVLKRDDLPESTREEIEEKLDSINDRLEDAEDAQEDKRERIQEATERVTDLIGADGSKLTAQILQGLEAGTADLSAEERADIERQTFDALRSAGLNVSLPEKPEAPEAQQTEEEQGQPSAQPTPAPVSPQENPATIAPVPDAGQEPVVPPSVGQAPDTTGDNAEPQENGSDAASLEINGACSDEALSENFPYRMCIRMFSIVGNDRRDAVLPEHLDYIRRNIAEADEEDDDQPINILNYSINPRSVADEVVVGFARVIQDPKGFNKLFNDQLPFAMILLIPIFSFFLRFWHWGGRRYYMNQVIFALHYHSFLFVFLIAMVIAAPYLSAEGLGEAFWIGTSLYLIISLKFGQKQGWFKAFFKAGFIYVPYVIMMGMILMGFTLLGLQEA